MLSETRLAVVQVPLQPQTLNKKFFRIALPWGVCATSGWNCKPAIPRSLPIAAMGEFSVEANMAKPAGSSTIWSPWLIHTGIAEGKSARRGLSTEF
jgi:hypothetical protein